ncbi:MAG: ABC transporter permease [Planctomycetes bacterium]|nr:ABC transporter permease [Planctomycetota bacterium]
MSISGVLAVALEGLGRKKGRNLLTMSGVLIGVFALTLIVSLGEGLAQAVTGTMSGTDNLRQIGLTGGFGIELSDKPQDVSIEGEMSDERRERLKRAAINRRQIRQVAGRRANNVDDATIERLKSLPHVERITPVIVERYQLQLGEYAVPATLTCGVDTSRRRYEERLIAGRYFSAPDAPEVILHEYLLYKWGLLSDADYSTVLGKTLTLNTIQTDAAAPPVPPAQLQELMKDLNEEERKALQSALPKVLKQFGMLPGERKAEQRQFKVVGVLRESLPGDVFNVIEDGNSVQVDVFLPQESARDFFLSSSVNRELGYPRAIVMADTPENAPALEQELRDKGYTAFSVASVLEQIETMLTVITTSIAFLTGIALLVSTLGIVNTMITSVLERTREIGIMKSVGATDSQVMGVFLAESALIGLVGGLLGLGLAALAMIPGDAIALKMVAERAAIPYSGDVFVLPLWLAVSGPALGMVTAVVAAILPARRAARIDPVKALRHD